VKKGNGFQLISAPLKEGLMLVYQGERAVDISLVSDEKKENMPPGYSDFMQPFEECYKRGGVAEIKHITQVL
jgi:hypothetical protein